MVSVCLHWYESVWSCQILSQRAYRLVLALVVGFFSFRIISFWVCCVFSERTQTAYIINICIYAYIHWRFIIALKSKTVAALVSRHLYNDVCVCVAVEFFHSIESNWNALNGMRIAFPISHTHTIAFETKIDRRHWFEADSIKIERNKPIDL